MSNKDLGRPDLDIGRIGVFEKVPLFLTNLLNFELMPSYRISNNLTESMCADKLQMFVIIFSG
jgi:hypothetical protein